MLSILLYLILISGLVYWIETPSIIGTNSLKIKKGPAELLEEWLKGFHFGNRNDLKGGQKLPKYKFYTDVVEVLLSLARKVGGNYEESLLFLRAGLQHDRQFEKKLKEMVIGIWLQMGLMMTLTWTFIIISLNLVDVRVSTFHLGMIFFWQALGLSTLPFLIKRFRIKFFGDIGKLWKMLYVLNSLVKVPLSRSEILVAAGVQDLKKIVQANLLHIVEKLKSICQRALQQGGSYEDEVLSLMEELRFQEKWHFELFEKRLTVIKLALLALFFLPSYLAFIFLLLGDLLGQM